MTSPRTPRQWGPLDSEPDRSLTLQDQDRDLIAYNFDEARGNVGWRYTWITGHETYYGGVPWSEFDESFRVAWPLSEVLPETPEPPQEERSLLGWALPDHLAAKTITTARDTSHHVVCRHISHEGGFPGWIFGEGDSERARFAHHLRDHAHVPASQSVPAVPVSSTGGKETGEGDEAAQEAATRQGLIEKAHDALRTVAYDWSEPTTTDRGRIVTALAEAGLLADLAQTTELGLLRMERHVLTAERDERQARLDAALTLMDYWDAHGGSIPQGHRLRALLRGDQPPAEGPTGIKYPEGHIVVEHGEPWPDCRHGRPQKDCTECPGLVPPLSGEALRDVEERDDAAGDLP